ncbi:MAG: hypothetical protein FGF48_04245 [Candidatus Brockarchaeota archaeon]|nr:hypothetical protein [Candidatus Brockarchaeota archaeon]
MERSLPEMVKEYLEAKYRDFPYPFHSPIVFPKRYFILSEEKLAVKKSLEGKKLKWCVDTIDAICMAVEEDEDGKVWVLSDRVDYVRDILYDYVKEKAYDIMLELRDRRNWKKYRKEKFGKVIAYLAWKDEVAERMTEKTGIKIVHQIGLPKYYDSKIEGIFYAIMNLKDVSDTIKFIFITKMIDAVDEAFRLGLYWGDFAREEFGSFMKKYMREKKRK